MRYIKGRSNLSCTIFVPWDCNNHCKFCTSKQMYKQRTCDIDAILAQIKKINEEMLSNFQKVGIFRYNAFDEMGGKLSFALTLLDGENNGFIINSMHSREGCYNYIKEIVKGASYIELSEEEAESLERAIFKETLGFDLENMKQ